jgi:hypothetical protein
MAHLRLIPFVVAGVIIGVVLCELSHPMLWGAQGGGGPPNCSTNSCLVVPACPANGPVNTSPVFVVVKDGTYDGWVADGPYAWIGLGNFQAAGVRATPVNHKRFFVVNVTPDCNNIGTGCTGTLGGGRAKSNTPNVQILTACVVGGL